MKQSDSPPLDRYCDLIMKGGITSGVVYPQAIARLSQHYRFKSIGGTSAGAIAAAVTAAAEYQRAQTGSCAGFERLQKLPEELAAKNPATGTSTLLSLFQPQRDTQRLFGVLTAALNSKSSWQRLANATRGLLRAYWPASLLALLIAALFAYLQASLLTTALVWLCSTVLLIGLWVYADLTRKLVGNGYGLCTGMTEGSTDALTPWLHALIQNAAGRKPGGQPLSFGDLWNANQAPDWLKQSQPWRAIDLQMFTTCLSHGRPYVFPLAPPRILGKNPRVRDRLYFKAAELQPYLPKEVLDWMMEKSRPYSVESGREGKDPSTAGSEDYRELPDPADLPVLLVARMSLSFPLLFSAVPLHAIDHDSAGQHQFKPCWFSDGGLSSNFPIHLFDGLVPAWPTFGITLEPEFIGRDKLYLPKRYNEGFGERWDRFAEKNNSSSRLGGFFIAILSTMQNWNDNTLARMPGVRDRIVRVRLAGHEGGLNLNMDSKLITNLAQRGQEAVALLINRFALPDPSGQASGWEEHRFVRINTLLDQIARRVTGAGIALDATTPHATPVPDLLDAMQQPGLAPPGFPDAMTAAQRAALEAAIEALKALGTAMQAPPGPTPFVAIPQPELRVCPPL